MRGNVRKLAFGMVGCELCEIDFPDAWLSSGQGSQNAAKVGRKTPVAMKGQATATVLAIALQAMMKPSQV